MRKKSTKQPQGAASAASTARKPKGSNVSRLPKQRYTFANSAEAWLLANQRLPNPDSILKKRGHSLKIYRDLLSDAHLSAVLESRESATLSYDWRIERGHCPTRLHDKISEWFFEVIERKTFVEDISRDELTANLLDVIYWGYQPAELTWEYLGGLWMPTQITPKPPEWFTWFIREDGMPELRFLSDSEPINGVPPPDPWTLICPRVKPTYDNPYGRGVATKCFWPIVFKRAGMEFWLNFMERFGTPWVKGTIEGNAQDDELRDFTNDLKVLVQDAVIAVAGNRDVGLLESNNQRGSNDGFKTLCDFMDAQLSKAVLGHTLSADTGTNASYAATKGALLVRDDIQARDIKMVRAIWDDIINLIFVRNGYLSTPRPKALHYRETDVETLRATRDEALCRAGAKFTKSYFCRVYHLEDDDIEDDTTLPDQRQATGLERPNDTDKTKQSAKEGVNDGGTLD